MSFLNRLSPRAKNAFYRALSDPTDWAHVVWLCIEEGERDVGFLTDIPFHLSHPELCGRNVLAHEATLISEWKVWNFIVRKMLPEEKRKKSDPTLSHWLQTLDVSKAPWRPNHNTWSHLNRVGDLERFRVFMLEASKQESLYETTYHAFKYVDGKGFRYWAHERTAFVLGFFKVSEKKALNVLKRGMERTRGNLKGMGKTFYDLERNFYAHVNVVARWAHGTAASDGPTDYVGEMKWLRELVSMSKRKTSIYSVHADQLKRVLAFKTDPNPRTAGLPF